MKYKNNKPYKIKGKQAGFTLIELLIAMLISLILIFACSSLYSSIKSSIKLAQGLSIAQESLRGSFYLLSRSARQAQAFTISGSTLTTIYGAKPAGSDVYNCLGQSVSGSVDTYRSDGDYLYCNDQKIALGVTEVEFVDISPSGAISTGVQVTMKIDGMPLSYSAAGITFNLALRQKILLDIAN